MVMSVVSALMNIYIYKRFFQKLHFNIQKLAKIFLIVLYIAELLFVAEASMHLLSSSLSIYYFVSVAFGVTILLFFITLLYDLLHTSAKRIPFASGRRVFIKVMFDVTMLVLLVSYFLSGFMGGVQKPKLKRVLVKIRGDIKNFKIAQLSDVHIGRSIDREFVQDLVDRINALEVDMVAITGDLIDEELAYIRDSLAPLRQLKSRYGTFFVSGNHEYFHNAPEIVGYLKTLNIEVLDNRSMLIGEGNKKINIVGIDDLISARIGDKPYDIKRAFSKVDSDYPTLFLAHQPKVVNVSSGYHYDLLLSGHTHGGQIFPFGLLVLLDQPYLAGLEQIDEQRQIYVSRGTGYWGPPIRVMAPSEITLLQLN
jgi:uncharacterized protein